MSNNIINSLIGEMQKKDLVTKFELLLRWKIPFDVRKTIFGSGEQIVIRMLSIERLCDYHYVLIASGLIGLQHEQHVQFGNDIAYSYEIGPTTIELLVNYLVEYNNISTISAKTAIPERLQELWYNYVQIADPRYRTEDYFIKFLISNRLGNLPEIKGLEEGE